jgi:biotin carboxyl carrier protein
MMGLNAYMERGALNRALGDGDLSTGFVLAVERGREAAALQASKGLPGVAGAWSKATMLRNMQEISARNVRIMSTILTVFASVIAVGVVYNNARIALAERSWEFASLRVLGFTLGEVSALLLGELAIVVALALPLGMALGWGLSHGVAELISSDQFHFPVVVRARTFAWARSACSPPRRGAPWSCADGSIASTWSLPSRHEIEMKTRTRISVAVAAVLAIGLLAWALAPRPLEVELATVTSGHFETTVDEDGKTRLRDRYVVAAPLAGLLSRVTLREGDAVAAGDVVATAVAGALADARRAHPARAAGPDRRRRGTGQARRGPPRGSAGRPAAGESRPAPDRAARRPGLRVLRPSSTSTGSPRSPRKRTWTPQSRIATSPNTRSSRRAPRCSRSVARTGRARGTFPVHAPIAGRVLRVIQPSESPVALGAPLIELGDTCALEIVAELLTTDALRTRPGSPVTIERWGGEGVLQGRVRRVEPGGFTKISALGRGGATGQGPDRHHQPGGALEGAGRRLSRQRADRDDGGRRGAQGSGERGLPAAGGARRRRPAPWRCSPSSTAGPSDPGRSRARNGSEAWLVKGVTLGQPVIVYPPPRVKDGARVEPRRTDGD